MDAFTNPTGNLQRVFAGIRGSGVWQSTAEGRAGSWSRMDGGVGKPLVQDLDVGPTVPVQVSNQGPTPNGAKGRIVLAKPFLTGDPRQDFMYQGWLYAAVVTPNDHLDGVYLTKDYGLNWTQLRIPTLPPLVPNSVRAVPTNDITRSDYDPLGNTQFAQGNYDVALTIDPTNPNIVYLGGTADGNPFGHDPDRRDRRQRPARVLPEQRPPRRRGPAQLCHRWRDDRVVESRGTTG